MSIPDLNIENRFTYHPPHGDQPRRYEYLRDAAKAFALAVENLCPSSPERTRAINHIDEAVMLANAAIARHEKPSQ